MWRVEDAGIVPISGIVLVRTGEGTLPGTVAVAVVDDAVVTSVSLDEDAEQSEGIGLLTLFPKGCANG
jgi:hypothetical protein